MVRVSAIPRAEGKVKLRDGRSLAYAEWGDPSGRPVVLFHGTPGSRLLCPDVDSTEAAGVRLITTDRPGYGGSDPDSNLSLESWAHDYTELHGQLGLPACPIVGWSGGGPYAIACALRDAALVSSVGLAASSAPPEEWGAGWEDSRRVADLLHRDRAAGLAALAAQYASLAEDPASIFDGYGTADDPDERLLAVPDVRDAMVGMVRESVRQGLVGVIADEVTICQPWGLSTSDVTQDVAVWLGSENEVCRAAAAFFAVTIPRASLVEFPGDGHLVPLSRWAEMLAWLH